MKKNIFFIMLIVMNTTSILTAAKSHSNVEANPTSALESLFIPQADKARQCNSLFKHQKDLKKQQKSLSDQRDQAQKKADQIQSRRGIWGEADYRKELRKVNSLNQQLRSIEQQIKTTDQLLKNFKCSDKH